MNVRIKGLLMLFLLFGCILTFAGLSGFFEKMEKYNCPVYMSKDFTVTYSGSYTLTGQLSNRTNQKVYIDKLIVRLTGNSHKTTYYADVTLTNLMVPANGTLEIHRSKINYRTNLLDSAHITVCNINGKNFEVKYSNDGISFYRDSNDLMRSTIMLVCGSVLLIFSATIVVNYLVKNRKNKRRI